jgi:hypothetical protein
MSCAKKKAWVLFQVVFLLGLGSRYSHGQSDSDLAKQAQNPIANLISLPFQNNTNFYAGPEEGTQNVLNIQPVLPFSVGANWNLVTRTIFPVTSLPESTAGGQRTNGLGNTLFTAFFSPKVSKVVWGVGPALSFPATNDSVGSEKWSLGPSLVLISIKGPWVIGSVFSNVWSFAGGSGDPLVEQPDVNFFTWQYFINFNFPGGSYVTTAPIITANWEADSGDKWTIPFGGGIGQVFKLGQQPINMSLQAYYNVKKPEFGGSWQLRFQWQFLFPK